MPFGFRGAHACSVLVAAFCGNELFFFLNLSAHKSNWEVREGRMPSPARETRALPRLALTAGQITSCINVDLPLPEIPVITDSLPTGKRTSISFKLFACAALISIQFSVSRSDLRDPRMGWQSGFFRQRAVSEFGVLSM